MVHLVERLADALEREVELLVGGIEVVEDRLQGGIGVHVVANVDEEAMRNVEEDRYLAEVVPEL
ncbi:MAG TPA: hypothetical protein VI277_05325 [Candidatus Limnocylindria bacterium]